MIEYPNLNELTLRVAAILREIFPTATVSTDPFFTGEAFPYFVVRIGAITFDDVLYDHETEEIDQVGIDVVIRHVVGHRTKGYIGESATKLYNQVGLLMQTFRSRELLQSEEYSDGMDFIDFALFTAGAGFAVIESSGIGVLQVGTEHTIRCEFSYGNDQEY